MTTNSEACGFAELFLSRASAYTQNYAISKSISLGSELVKLYINKETYFGGLIFNAFLDSNLPEKNCKYSTKEDLHYALNTIIRKKRKNIMKGSQSILDHLQNNKKKK